MHTHKREYHHRRDDGERARELDHGGEVARALAEGIACGDDAGGVVDRRARPQAVGHIGKAHRAAHDGKEHDHRHIKEEGRGEGVGDVAVLGVDDGCDCRDGAAAADAGARGDEVRELPVQTQRAADEVAAAEAGKERKEHDGQRHSADVQDGRDVQARAEENDGKFQDLLRRKLHAGRGGLAGLAVAVDEHTDEHGDDGRADDVERQQGLDALGEQSDDEREREARRVAFDLSGNGAHGDLTSLCR